MSEVAIRLLLESFYLVLGVYTHTQTHAHTHTAKHREATLAHGLHMAKPTFIRASVNMCVRVCVCHSDTKFLPDMVEGISISVSCSLPLPAVLSDTHVHMGGFTHRELNH